MAASSPSPPITRDTYAAAILALSASGDFDLAQTVVANTPVTLERLAAYSEAAARYVARNPGDPPKRSSKSLWWEAERLFFFNRSLSDTELALRLSSILKTHQTLYPHDTQLARTRFYAAHVRRLIDPAAFERDAPGSPPTLLVRAFGGIPPESHRFVHIAHLLEPVWEPDFPLPISSNELATLGALFLTYHDFEALPILLFLKNRFPRDFVSRTNPDATMKFAEPMYWRYIATLTSSRANDKSDWILREFRTTRDMPADSDVHYWMFEAEYLASLVNDTWDQRETIAEIAGNLRPAGAGDPFFQLYADVGLLFTPGQTWKALVDLHRIAQSGTANFLAWDTNVSNLAIATINDIKHRRYPVLPRQTTAVKRFRLFGANFQNSPGAITYHRTDSEPGTMTLALKTWLPLVQRFEKQDEFVSLSSETGDLFQPSSYQVHWAELVDFNWSVFRNDPNVEEPLQVFALVGHELGPTEFRQITYKIPGRSELTHGQKVFDTQKHPEDYLSMPGPILRWESGARIIPPLVSAGDDPYEAARPDLWEIFAEAERRHKHTGEHRKTKNGASMRRPAEDLHVKVTVPFRRFRAFTIYSGQYLPSKPKRTDSKINPSEIPSPLN